MMFAVTRRFGRFFVDHVPSPLPPPNWPTVLPPPVHHFDLHMRGRHFVIRDPAAIRGWMTLISLLNPEQVRELSQHGYVSVTGSRGGLYRVHMDSSITGNVEQVSPARWMCAHLDDPWALPAPDHFLGQILYLRLNEPRFRHTAL
jgi:hypothetical protein